MPSYLERYLAGEYERVWSELIELGPRVRNEPLLGDATEVAHEIMRRVRQNLETLVPRLAQIGYRFGYGWLQPSQMELYDWRQRKQLAFLFTRSDNDLQILSVAPDVDAELADRRLQRDRLVTLDTPAIILANEARMIAELDAKPRQPALVDELEHALGRPLTLALRAWFEVVDGVNFVGEHPEWLRLLLESGHTLEWWTNGFDPYYGGHPLWRLEPLHVLPLACVAREYRDRAAHMQPEQEPRLCVIPNAHVCYLEIGQDNWWYEIIPTATADGPLRFSTPEATFVGYLRAALRWGGFPGWEQVEIRPERDLAFLTKDLIPF